MDHHVKQSLPIIALLAASQAVAQETRELGSHEHGVGELNIAFEGEVVAIEFQAPGADIVGFEYAAESAEDRAAVEDAVAMLARPLDLFVLPGEAECTVTQASAELESDEDHEDHDHDEDHAEDDHDHGEEDHADDHSDEARHTEFHAEYTLNCANPDALTQIDFAYFDIFENALELEVQTIAASGAQAFEVTRDAPLLDLRNLF